MGCKGVQHVSCRPPPGGFAGDRGSAVSAPSVVGGPVERGPVVVSEVLAKAVGENLPGFRYPSLSHGIDVELLCVTRGLLGRRSV